jgi:hypothetical protein
VSLEHLRLFSPGWVEEVLNIPVFCLESNVKRFPFLVISVFRNLRKLFQYSALLKELFQAKNRLHKGKTIFIH